MWLPAGYVNFLVKTLLKLKVTDKAIDKLKTEECAIGPVVHERAIGNCDDAVSPRAKHGT
jgi:hypothetical protein